MIFIPQHDQMDCGPACLAMIAQMHSKECSLQYLKENSFISREGVSLLELSDTAKSLGFETLSAKLTVEELKQMHLPCILHWNQNHYVILAKISKNIFQKKHYLK